MSETETLTPKQTIPGFKTKTYYVRPHFVYFSLGLLVLIHVIAKLTSTPAFIQLMVNSLACVYVGSMENTRLKVNATTNKLEKVINDEENNEAMTKKDAAMFPVYLSGYLFGLYILFKLIDKVILSAMLSGFFSLMGVICLMGVIEDAIEKYFSLEFSTKFVINKNLIFNFVVYVKQVQVQLTKLNFVSFSIALGPVCMYLFYQDWVCNNLIAIAFSIAGIANFNIIPSFKVGMLMLWGLFFYDIFWVYGTDVMITVAKSIDAPIKLMFPYNLLEVPPKFSMLGLGDIVIPGIFVALALKYDIDQKLKTAKKLSEIDIGYFTWCFCGYSLGMITTFVVMVVFDHPQPALLFLVPGCTFSVILKAFFDKKLPEFWAYEQEDLKKKEVVFELPNDNDKKQ